MKVQVIVTALLTLLPIAAVVAEELRYPIATLAPHSYVWELYDEGFSAEPVLISGGPVSHSFSLPADVVAIQAARLYMGGTSYAGCFWVEGEVTDCAADAAYPGNVGDMFSYVEIPDLASWHVSHQQDSEGFWFRELSFSGSQSLNLLLGQTFNIVAHTQPVYSYPTLGWIYPPRVDLQFYELRFDVDRVVAVSASGWGQLKALY